MRKHNIHAHTLKTMIIHYNIVIANERDNDAENMTNEIGEKKQQPNKITHKLIDKINSEKREREFLFENFF